MNKRTLVIMAAGMGSRYGGIKQIDPMGPSGETILDYSVFDALRAGFNQVVFIIRRDIEKDFREIIGTRFEKSMDVQYAFQDINDLPSGFSVPEGREKPWGTTHALLSCRNIVSNPFLVINADDFYGSSAYKQGIKGLSELNTDKLEGFLVGYVLENTLSLHGTVTRGVCQTSDGYLSGIAECSHIKRNPEGLVEYSEGAQVVHLTGREVVSMNFWGFTPAIFPRLLDLFEEFVKKDGNKLKSEALIPEDVGALMKRDQMRVRVYSTDASWFGVTYPEDKESVKTSLLELINSGEYDSPLWS